MNLQLSPDDLVSTLDRLEVPFLAGAGANSTSAVTPVELLTQLAQAPEARLRLAIIPTLLRHPEFARDSFSAAMNLTGQPRLTLECFYTAALLLQRKEMNTLTRLLGAQFILPDWFSAELGIVLSENVDASLRHLGERHAALTGLRVNWVGTYSHAAERLIRRLENQARWAQVAPRGI